MTTRPIFTKGRRRPLYIAFSIMLVIVALLLAAGCLRPQLCGGKFEVYELEDYIRPGENVVHLTEQDFRDNPDLNEVMRGVKRTNATCDEYYYMFGHCIGGSYFECGGKVRLLKYFTLNESATQKDQKFLEYGGKYYFMRITSVF
jgi:hypothetical protein